MAKRGTLERVEQGNDRDGVAEAGGVAGAVGWVTAGSMVANVCAYVVHLAAGRWWLSPDEYGEFAVLLSAQLVLAVPGLAIQAVVARDVVRGRDLNALRRLTVATVVAVAVLAVVATPAVAAITSTSVAASAAALASAPALALIGAGQGVVQGLRRFRVLAAMLAGVGVARLVPVMVALAVGAGPAGGLLIGSVGAWAAAVVVAVVSIRPRLAARSTRPAEDAPSRWSSRVRSASGGPVSRPLTDLLDVARAGQVQLVLIVASSADLLLSRHVLTASVAGVYALGAIATKVAFWLPQAIGVVFYPRLAHPASSGRSLRQAVFVVTVVGAVLTVAAGVAGPLVPVLVTDDYRALTSVLWLFAYTGAAWAVLQVALLSAIARNATSASVITWVVVGVEVVVIVVMRPDSIVGLAVIAAAAATVSAVTTTLWCLRAGRRGSGRRRAGRRVEGADLPGAAASVTPSVEPTSGTGAGAGPMAGA